VADIYAIWVKKRLDPMFREEIMVAVARANSCRFCDFVHGQWALAQGLQEEDLARIGSRSEPQEGKSERALALAFAQALASGDFALVDPAPAGTMRERFGETATRDVETVARVMTLANLSANTADAFFSRLKDNPSTHSRLADELILGAAFALVYPLMMVVLAVLQRRTPLAVLRDFLRFKAPGTEET